MDMIVYGYIVITLLGLVMGSFAGATVWRLRARQLIEDKAASEPYDTAELKRLMPLTKDSLKDDRSRCLSCQHKLAWYDLLPMVSWLSTNGKCRYCHKPIGRFEPFIELATAASFVAFYAFWLSVNGFGFFGILAIWLAVIVMLVILFAYDAKWFLLPDVVMFPLIALSTILAAINILQSSDPVRTLASTIVSVGILGGIYLALWLISKGKWVGFGDVKLGVALGLLLADWKSAFLALFLANFIGTLLVLPGLITRKLNRTTQVPFGPLLILGFAIALLFGQNIIDGYEAFSAWLSSMLLMV